MINVGRKESDDISGCCEERKKKEEKERVRQTDRQTELEV